MQYVYNWILLISSHQLIHLAQCVNSAYFNVMTIHISHKKCGAYLDVLSFVITASVICQ